MNNFNINNLVRDNIKHLKPYSSARDEFKDFNTDMIFLDANENPFENGVNRYPDPQQLGLKAILAKEKGIYQENIVLGNGSDELLDLIVRGFCEPKEDSIITVPPTFSMFNVLARINNIKNNEVLLTNDFELDIDQILSTLDQTTKIIFICSPNNPTGNTFNNQNIKNLLNSFSGLVVIDEAYIDFSDQESWVNQLNEFPNLVITQTLSKAYGLAGIRLGMCYASPEIISILNKIKLPYNVNKLTQKRAMDRMNDMDIVRSEINSILHERDLIFKQLHAIKFISKVYPSDANFILVKVDNAVEKYMQLTARGLVIRNTSNRPLCENTLRLTIGTPEENKKLIQTLKELDT